MTGTRAETGTPNRASSLPAPPACLAELVRLIGPEPTLALIQERGGIRTHVPKPGGVERSKLRAVVGAEPLMRLAKAMGGSTLELPLCKNWRVLMILHAGVHSRAEIALKVGVSLRLVRKLSPPGWGCQRPKRSPETTRRLDCSLQHDLSDVAHMLIEAA